MGAYLASLLLRDRGGKGAPFCVPLSHAPRHPRRGAAMRTPTFRSGGVTLLALVFIVALAGCSEWGGFSFGSTSYTDVTDPSLTTGVSTPELTGKEWRATVAAFEGIQNEVYERGYRDGHNVNCDLFEQFNSGEVSQTYAEREIKRIHSERAGAYASRTLAAQYMAAGRMAQTRWPPCSSAFSPAEQPGIPSSLWI